jgi:adenine-specific DNA-methyltransferase
MTASLNDTATSDAVSGVYRPIQYLGSKIRVLKEVVAAINDGGPEQAVWEPFSGSSVVGQALAGAGHRVVAADALLSSATLAEAMLGVGRPDSASAVEDAIRVLERARVYPMADGWSSWLAEERRALTARDGAALLDLHAAVPQMWRQDGQGMPSSQAGEAPALLSEVFAGTYFSLEQALRLERLRTAVQDLEASGDLSAWGQSAALTALCASASQAVFSAGKHFAQPHRTSAGKSLDFHAKRALADRSVDVEAAFIAAAAHVDRTARPRHEEHHAYQGLVEDVTVKNLQRWGITSVYADPPYTAQQYSRFYHVLETLVTGHRAPMQLVNGRVTTGLYPQGRYLSPFCSRRQAPAAFTHLARTCADAGARLVLSYSGNPSPDAVTGNARSVTIHQLVACCEAAYGARRVHVVQLGVGYRQFNRSASEVTGRQESEYLIIGEPVAS